MTIAEKKDVLKTAINPHTTNFLVKIKEIEFENQYKELDGVLVSLHKEVEASNYHKVYRSSDHTRGIYSLTPSALKLYTWIQYNTGYGEDFVYLNRPRAIKDLDLSVNTMKKIVKELQIKGFITATVYRSIYWVNP